MGTARSLVTTRHRRNQNQQKQRRRIHCDCVPPTVDQEADEETLPPTQTQTSSSSLTQQQSGSVAAATDSEGWTRRATVVSFCFVAFLLCNMDRVNMSVSILPMAEQYGWSDGTKGLVQSSFFWGYLLTQVLGGVLSDRAGGKVVLGFGVAWWSLFTAITPYAASLGLGPLLAARAMMGVGEGVAMPAMNNLVSRWVPAQERSRSLARVYSGMFCGSILGLLASPPLIERYDWPTVFHLFGSLGVVWIALWFAPGIGPASTPTKDTVISAEERAMLAANVAVADDNAKPVNIPWRALLSKRAVWAIILCHFCHNWGTFILLTWTPTYYHDVLGFDIYSSSYAAVLPWVSQTIMANIAATVADTRLLPNYGVTKTRKVMQSIGFLGPAVCLTLLPEVNEPTLAIALLCASQGLDAFSHSGLYSNHQDIAPRYAGVLLGLSNSAGVLAGVLGTGATGALLEASGGDWAEVWSVAVILYMVGTAIWLSWSTGERVVD